MTPSLSAAAFSAAAISLPTNNRVQQIIPFPGGGRVAWSWGDNSIYFDRQANLSHVLPYVCLANGNAAVALTLPSNPGFSIGNPAVSPSGNQIMLQVAQQSGSGLAANPGVGQFNDIYLGVLSGKAVVSWRQLTNVGASGGFSLHPKFSPDGTKIAWSQSSNGTEWKLVWANSDGSDVQAASPGFHGFYELGSWGDDNQTIYCAETDQGGGVFKNIYSFNTATGAHVNLTNTEGQWFEFPQFRNGLIAYVSSVGSGVTPTQQNYPLDAWVMSATGATPTRLTTYNQPGSPQCYAFKVADLEWNQAGTRLVALLYAMPDRMESVAIITV